MSGTQTVGTGTFLEECPFCVGVQPDLCSCCNGAGKVSVPIDPDPYPSRCQSKNPPF